MSVAKNGSEGSEHTDKAFCFEEVLKKELEELASLRAGKHPTPPDGHGDDESVYTTAHKADLSGLAFSGGGIRSATFNLGIIQGFAKQRAQDKREGKTGLMSRFDYLSTVSGGGYIGSWLSAWLHRDKQDQPTAILDDDFQKKISTRPCGFGPMAKEDADHCAESSGFTNGVTTAGFPPLEHAAVRYLRRYSNYLSPRVGLSGDMLALVSLVLRNLVLLQLALITLLATAVFIPYLLASATLALGAADSQLFGLPAAQAALAVGIIIILLVLASCSRQLVQLPEQSDAASRVAQPPSERRHKLRINWINSVLVIICAFASWLIIAGALAIEGVAPILHYVVLGALTYSLAWIGGYLFFVRSMRARAGVRPRMLERDNAKLLLVTLIAGAVFGLVAFVCALALDKEWVEASENVFTVIALGPPLLMLAISFIVAVHIGVARDLFSALHREWWARFGGYILFAIIGWSVLFTIAYFAPPLGQYLGKGGLAAVAAWVGASGAGAWFGCNGSDADPNKKSRTKTVLMRVAPWLFLLGLAAIVSYSVNRVLIAACPAVLPAQCNVNVTWPATVSLTEAVALAAREFEALNIVPTFYALLFAALAFGLISMRLDINIFSAHSLYRNRLVRAYLGASRAGNRQSHVFTGFDPYDDVPLEKLNAQRPIQILNTTINMTGGDDLAWQTRRAASFVFTPHFVGYETRSSQGADLGGYRRTSEFAAGEPPATPDANGDTEQNGTAGLPFTGETGEFATTAGTNTTANKALADKDLADKAVADETGADRPRGLSLGTAMAISGAAASPNMGYHSSPAVAALLTAFNLRLGFWAGNPAAKPDWWKTGRKWNAWWKKRPLWSGRLILSELTGSASAESSWINLTDGGHFDNLGIYELIRRRCRLIVVTDAGCDPDHEFTDLANTIRKCWTDFGVHIVFPKLQQLALNEDTPRVCETHGSLGLIEYPDRERAAEDRYGLIIYLKSSLTKNELDNYVDIRQYATANKMFPHQTTGDQFFDENQFEAYRHLGFSVAQAYRNQIDSLFDRDTGRINKSALLEKVAAIDAMQPSASMSR